MPEPEVEVLIVGGGPTGLAASLLLSRHGVRSLLVERHPGTSLHPKARGLNVRTMELFRVWGVEVAVRAAAGELDRAADVVWAPTLVDPETRREPYGGVGDRLRADSPTTDVGCAQDRLEPVLLDAGRSSELGEFRFGQELRGLSQDGDGATATVVEVASGAETSIRARFVIAADGARSPVRALLGVELVGPGTLTRLMGIYFRADLTEVGATRPALLYLIQNPSAPGVIAAVNLADRWLYMAPIRSDQGERVEDFSEERCVQLVRAATGVADLDAQILAAQPWEMAAATATRFRDGPVFLAGDAAHLIPPTGGQAMNVGIQDVHNLAWKLAGVLRGWAGPRLLDTYDAERRPFALAVTADATQNLAAGEGRRPGHFNNRGRVLGVSYDSSAVIPDGIALPAVDNPVVEYVPTARPGSRAPHLWLGRGDERISALDLYDTRFVLLAGPAGQQWRAAGAEVGTRLGISLDCYTVGPTGTLTDRAGEWAVLYGVAEDGAVLVRPDGHVAWRASSAGSDPTARLTDALRRIAARD
jgi:2-polyprenyl-6-methoxyphenol hydroxylase-like FAD-dependent oxidoreductase